MEDGHVCRQRVVVFAGKSTSNVHVVLFVVGAHDPTEVLVGVDVLLDDAPRNETASTDGVAALLENVEVLHRGVVGIGARRHVANLPCHDRAGVVLVK
jgi:hypothetical protein